jgi:hypothetical protein
MIKLHKIGLVCLIETKVKETKADLIKNAIVLDWGFVVNYEKHILGRIWICWNKSEFDVTVFDTCRNSRYSLSLYIYNIYDNLTTHL